MKSSKLILLLIVVGLCNLAFSDIIPFTGNQSLEDFEKTQHENQNDFVDRAFPSWEADGYGSLSAYQEETGRFWGPVNSNIRVQQICFRVLTNQYQEFLIRENPEKYRNKLFVAETHQQGPVFGLSWVKRNDVFDDGSDSWHFIEFITDFTFEDAREDENGVISILDYSPKFKIIETSNSIHIVDAELADDPEWRLNNIITHPNLQETLNANDAIIILQSYKVDTRPFVQNMSLDERYLHLDKNSDITLRDFIVEMYQLYNQDQVSRRQSSGRMLNYQIKYASDPLRVHSTPISSLFFYSSQEVLYQK